MHDEQNNAQVVHKPVLMQEVLDFLAPQPGKVYVDATLGGGGHTRAILELEPTCKVIGLDWDETVIATTGQKLQEEFAGRFIPIRANFAKIHEALKKNGYDKVDGILADFGTSQIQIANTAGLSIYQNAFLDMRMAQGYFKTTAYDIIRTASEKELAKIFFDYGQERYGNKIAKAIVTARVKQPLKTTQDLAKLIESVVPWNNKKQKIHPATRVFQALRIVVNAELENIESFLHNVTLVLGRDSRLVCISFHSLEDRIVKLYFKDLAKINQKQVEILTPKVCVATEEEIALNRSSRSAKLRAIKFDI
jgi:16S rRNA (cytosine1402-N4)-methyltransferase